jgi:Spy/CpxP family protein refolding chaperone
MRELLDAAIARAEDIHRQAELRHRSHIFDDKLNALIDIIRAAAADRLTALSPVR